MHPNNIFRKSKIEQNIDFAQQRSFGILAINGENGPVMAHIPFIIRDNGKTLEGHLVRSNPILSQLSEPNPAVPAVVEVSGPDSYISPDWYEIDNQVPTWNYVALNIRGTLKKLPDEQLERILEETSQHFEKRLAPKPVWTLDKMDNEKLIKMKRMIVPIAVEISSIEGTWKLSQNKPAQVRQSAANATRTNGIGHEIREIADLMQNPPC